MQIKKSEVDNFEEGKRIPSCQLRAKCEIEQPTDLNYSMLLKGAVGPYSAFVISGKNF